jgi:hypothetical protein
MTRFGTTLGGRTRELIAMIVVLLAGGLGTWLAEETEVRPKPRVEIVGRPKRYGKTV